MEALFTSTAVVALAEIGDKTQLLAILLATRFNRPVPIILGILVATLANHALAAWVGMAAGAIWLAMFFIFRLSSLAGLTAAALAPILALFVFDRPYPIAVMALVMAVLIFIRHKDNIGRLLKGEEPRSGTGKKKDPA